jgi:hypothetical protein
VLCAEQNVIYLPLSKAPVLVDGKLASGEYDDAVVLGGNAAITATAGNVLITNPGTINGSVADVSSLTITTTGAGTVTLNGAIGATAKLKDLIINAAGDVVITGPISLAGRLSITSASGKITLRKV